MAETTCYMCPAEATTDEHIPPRCFFPAGRRKITVPSCHAHNKGKSEEDKYALSVLSACLDQNPIAAEVHGKKIGAYIEKYSRGSDTLQKRYFPDLDLQKRSFSVDVPRFDSWIRMLVRGLYFYETGEKLMVDILVVWGFLRKQDLQPSEGLGMTYFAESLLPPISKGEEPDVFAYDYHRDIKGELLFRLRFFEGTPVYATAPNPNATL